MIVHHSNTPEAPTYGLRQKFIVNRVDGRDQPGGDRVDADYFVLDLTYDPLAWHALETYAERCKGTYPDLARDLNAKIEQHNAVLVEQHLADCKAGDA